MANEVRSVELAISSKLDVAHISQHLPPPPPQTMIDHNTGNSIRYSLRIVLRTATGREHIACQDSGISQIFILIISNEEKILSSVNVVV